jgi:hypothetical protein
VGHLHTAQRVAGRQKTGVVGSSPTCPTPKRRPGSIATLSKRTAPIGPTTSRTVSLALRPPVVMRRSAPHQLVLEQLAQLGAPVRDGAHPEGDGTGVLDAGGERVPLASYTCPASAGRPGSSSSSPTDTITTRVSGAH